MTQPGGAWLRSRPQASLTSEPWTLDPSIFEGPETARFPGRNALQDAAQVIVALTSMCSAESHSPLSWMFFRLSS